MGFIAVRLVGNILGRSLYFDDSSCMSLYRLLPHVKSVFGMVSRTLEVSARIFLNHTIFDTAYSSNTLSNYDPVDELTQHYYLPMTENAGRCYKAAGTGGEFLQALEDFR